jgi:tetratricopeptide (TPR) repeat protein
MTLTSGDRLGPYEIVEPIGEGAMGQVYRAHDTRLGRDVAVKVLPNAIPDAEALSRFEREGRAASALSHPNICAVYDVGDADRRPYLVMELLQGVTLRSYIDGRPLDVAMVLDFATQVADALDAAHAKGIIHRDVKPGNIMITGRHHVKVLDFGLAKLVPQGESNETMTVGSVTAAGTVAGTPHYMAPELMTGADADTRSDVWALGIVTYEMLTGRVPFTGATAMAIASSVLRDEVPPLPEGTPSGLRSVVGRCLARRPEDRYQRAGEVRAALEALQSVAAIPATAATPRDPSTPRGDRHWWWMAAAAAALAIAGVVWWRVPERATPRLSTGGPASVNRDANDAFELAIQFQQVQNDIPRAQQYLERALALDARFAEALRYHATNYAILILNGYSNDVSLLYKAEEELMQASGIDPRLPGLPSALATVYLTQGRKELVPWDQLDEALRQNPSHVNNRLWRGIASWLAGNTGAAQQDFRTILTQVPLMGPARMFLGETLRETGDVQGAIGELNRVLEQAPNNIAAIQWLTLAHLDNGDLPKARQLLEDQRSIFSANYLWQSLSALTLASAGERDDALKVMNAETLKFAAAAFPSTLVVAEFYAVLGDSSQAIEWLERTVRNGDERTELFRRSTRLTAVRQDPRFQRIVDSVQSRRRSSTR